MPSASPPLIPPSSTSLARNFRRCSSPLLICRTKIPPPPQAAREQMAQAMTELAKQAEEMGISLPGLEEAIKALQADQTDLMLRDLQLAMHDLEKLKDIAKAMQNLQQQMAKLGKDLAEQLKNGQAQAAQSTLQKMMEQLKQSNLSKSNWRKSWTKSPKQSIRRSNTARRASI